MKNASASSPLTIAQLRDNSFSGVVRHEIERMILSGELPTGSRLNEVAIAARMGTSRGPVREACRALVELGLLELIPNRGVFVRRMDKHDAAEVYDLRAGLTGLAGSLLAPRVTPDQIEELQVLVGTMDEAANAGDFQEFYQQNLEFHDLIVQFTGNSRLVKSYRALVKEFHLFRMHGLVQGDSLKESNREHKAMVAAIASADARLSYDTGFGHVANGKKRMTAALEKLAKEGTNRAAGGPPDNLLLVE
jgi:DNA-binding GntR family transcriptional regulator